MEALHKAGIINWKSTQVSESVVTFSVYRAGLETLVEDVARVRRSRLRPLSAEFPTCLPRRWCVLGIGTSCSSAWT